MRQNLILCWLLPFCRVSSGLDQQRRTGLGVFFSNAAAAVRPGRGAPRPIQNDEEDGHDLLNLHPLLQIPCGMSLSPQCTGTVDNEGGSSSSRSSSSIQSPALAAATSVDRIWAVPTFLDTGAQRTVMSYESAKASGFLLANMDRRYAGQARGVSGSCAMVGRIPAGVCQMHLGGGCIVPSPAIYVLESSSSEFLLGLDFLREHRAIIDIGTDELRLRQDRGVVSVPFIRPRGELAGLERHQRGDFDTDDEDDGGYADDENYDMSGL